MNTGKPISTISYNTEPFLHHVLDCLVSEKTLSFYAYVFHRGENDESAMKDHFHVFCIPNHRINTAIIHDRFLQVDHCNADGKPLGCIFFNSSKFSDWYLYSIHDPSYLMRKGIKRKFFYSSQDVICSDPDEFNFLLHNVDDLSTTPYAVMLDSIRNGLSFREFFNSGRVPIQQVRNYQIAYALCSSDSFDDAFFQVYNEMVYGGSEQ